MHPTIFHLAQAASGVPAASGLPALEVPEGIYDILVPEAERPVWPLLVYLILALLLIAGLVWLFLYLLRNRETSGDSKAAASRALRELDSLERRRDELTPNAFALAVSETLKNYLAERHRDPVRYETTEEFLDRLSRHDTCLPPDAQQALREFLTSAEEVKFGHRPDAASSCAPLLQRARQLFRLTETVDSADGGKKA